MKKGIFACLAYLFMADALGNNVQIVHLAAKDGTPSGVFSKGNKNTPDPGDIFELAYFRRLLTPDYTAISYQASAEDIEYQYKFAEEMDWHSTSVRDSAFLALSPGTHSLLFRAKKKNSDWSTPANISIKVNPLWYQTTWFWSSMCFLALLAGFVIIQLRHRTITPKEEGTPDHLRQIRQLESQALLSQMNPHFIFNSLNTVQHLILTKNEQQSLDFLSDFAVLMRRMLELSRKQLITLAEEIDFLTRYMQLEAMRFNHCFTFSILIDECLFPEEILIPPALLQPLLENAIKHGVSPLNSNGNIELTVCRDGEFLVAVVEDNGVGMQAHNNVIPTGSKKRESTALKILTERLNLMRTRNGRQSTINITDMSSEHLGSHGTRIELKIPIQ